MYTKWCVHRTQQGRAGCKRKVPHIISCCLHSCRTSTGISAQQTLARTLHAAQHCCHAAHTFLAMCRCSQCLLSSAVESAGLLHLLHLPGCFLQGCRRCSTASAAGASWLLDPPAQRQGGECAGSVLLCAAAQRKPPWKQQVRAASSSVMCITA
jgi:hypothetical protein